MTRILAHVSDLHFGRDARTDGASAALAHALLEAHVHEVLVTGDVTHRGRRRELATFEHAFARLGERLLVVPGNHDRLGENAGAELMHGPRVQVAERSGLFVVRVDSTAAHNRRLVDGHGELTNHDLRRVDAAMGAAPPGSLVAVMLHHHLLPLPTDDLADRLATWLGWPTAQELQLGRELIEVLRGRCDLVLHGHRHRAAEVVVGPSSARPLRIWNAGCSPELRRVRALEHCDGRVVAERWLVLDVARPAPEAPEPLAT